MCVAFKQLQLPDDLSADKEVHPGSFANVPGKYDWIHVSSFVMTIFELLLTDPELFD